METAVGALGKRVEQVAKEASRGMRQYMQTTVPVGDISRTNYCCRWRWRAAGSAPVSRSAQTNRDVLQAFLGADTVQVAQAIESATDPAVWTVRVRGALPAADAVSRQL